MKNLFARTVLTALWLFSCHVSFAAVPHLINYQGRLTDDVGRGITGTNRLEFSIYPNAVGGDAVWGPQIFETEVGHVMLGTGLAMVSVGYLICRRVARVSV